MYDFSALDDYFQRINKWKGLTEEDKLEIYKASFIGSYPSIDIAIETVEQILKERNLS